MTLPLTSTCVGGRRSGLVVPIFTRTPKQEEPQGLKLTDRERQVIDAYIRTGIGKVAAQELGTSVGAIHEALSRACARNDFNGSIQLVAAYVTEQLKGNQ